MSSPHLAGKNMKGRYATADSAVAFAIVVSVEMQTMTGDYRPLSELPL